MVDIENYSRFLFYNSKDGKISVQVLLDNDNETIWTTQKGMAAIFNCSTDNIGLHLKNIFKEGELEETLVTEKSSVTASDGKTYNVKHYNLDAIIAVGYRVNSYQATQFRIWATKILKEYMAKGFALDDERLKQGNRLFGKDFFKELVERVQEIRASERMYYEKVTDIFRDCSSDYDPKSPTTKIFYAKMQNMLHYASNLHTSAELIKDRADATKPNMGLTTWANQKKGGKIYKSDVISAKNYLSHDELKALNKLVNMFLDYAEHQASRGIVFTMAEWAEKLEIFLKFNDYPILDNKGRISREIAEKFALNEYAKFRPIQDRNYKSDFNILIEATHNSLPLEEFIITESKEQKETSQFDNALKKALNYNPHEEEPQD